MGMSGPCKWHSSISIGDEPLASSGLKSIERHYRRGKDFPLLVVKIGSGS